MNPDGSPFEARKPLDLRDKKGRMFEKLKMVLHRKAKGTLQQS